MAKREDSRVTGAEAEETGLLDPPAPKPKNIDYP